MKATTEDRELTVTERLAVEIAARQATEPDDGGLTGQLEVKAKRPVLIVFDEDAFWDLVL